MGRTLWLAGLVVASAIRVKYAGRRQRTARHAMDMDAVLLLLNSLGMLVFPAMYLWTDWLRFADYQLPAGAVWGVAAVTTLGMWLLWRSHADLGASFSPALQVQAGQALVTDGVFRYMRHPMYAAHVVWALGQPLLLHNWVAGLGFLPRK